MATYASGYGTAFPLATENPCTGDDCGGGTGGVDTAAGASGSDSDSIEISKGAMTAIIVVVVCVALLGIGTSVLFYIAKKREWKIRESIRKSARTIVTALTPRRSEFPKSVKESRPRSSRGRTRMDDVPPTPRLRPEDVEKGLAQAEVKRKQKRWARK